MLQWLLEQAVVLGVRDFQRKDTGETVFQVSLGYMGGKVELQLPPGPGREFQQHAGQKCKVGGPLEVDVRQFGKNVETRVQYHFGKVEWLQK